jgi:hypothetical protein
MKKAPKRVAAHGRQGRPPTVRDLEQILRFACLDWGALSLGERLDWHRWTFDFATGEEPRSLLTSKNEDAEDEMRDMHARLAAWMSAVRDGGPWRVPPLPQRVLWHGEEGLTIIYDGPPADVFLNRVAEALVTHKSLIEKCPQCPRLFVARRRRRYCSPECTQKAQWARFLQRHGDRPRDYQVEYRKRIRKETGQRHIRLRKKEKE